MAQSALSPTPVKVTGERTHLYIGCAGGSGTTTTVTLPGNCVVRTVVVGGAQSATAPYCDTISANTFLITHGNNELFTYVALVTKGF